MDKTRKPLKVWFRAIWEVCVHRPGISAKDLQRILGFGSYETAWTWLHKIRTLTVRPKREPLDGMVQLDESFVRGGRKKEAAIQRRGKSIVLVGAELGGRIRLLQSRNNDEPEIQSFANHNLTGHSDVTTDGLASYNSSTLGSRTHQRVVQTPAERAQTDALQCCHWAASQLKRWLLGTHHGATSTKHLQSYLDEFSFRYNRRKTKGVGRLTARLLENIGHYGPRPMKHIVNQVPFTAIGAI